MGGEAAGGWLCAGKTIRACAVLRHGFIPNAQAQGEQRFGGFPNLADLASTNYLQIHDGLTDPDGPTLVPCPNSGTMAWSCSYNTPTGAITVTISFKKATGGWITTGHTERARQLQAVR
jgi:hypothetical protein